MKTSNKNFVKKYKDNLVTAYYYQYTSALPQDVLSKLDAIYTEETGENLQTNFSCGHCVLFLLGKLGRLFFREYPEEKPEGIENNK